MEVPKIELISVLAKFNPWWRGGSTVDLPIWRRAAFKELYEWTRDPPAQRAIFLSGARQVGKTTLLLQLIDKLIQDGIPPSNILYATMDHPLLKLAGIDVVLEAWRELETKKEGIEYVFLDEAQVIRDWGTWIKLQVDFEKRRRIIFTGSALPLSSSATESGVGRWHVCKLATLSFYEYLQIKKVLLPELPKLHSLTELFLWEKKQYIDCSIKGEAYLGHFHEYLLRGGFPQTALVENIDRAQQLVREDIIDKVLKRDMTAFYGVRRVLELESTFLYLCMHDGGILDMVALCKNLEVKRPTAQSFIELLESVHLIYKLSPYGYGKDILRAKFKIYLTDASMAPAVFLKGKSMLEDPISLGQAVETTIFKHLASRYYRQSISFSYWKNKKDQEVDFLAELGNEVIPFEVKYRETNTDKKVLKGIFNIIETKNITRGYIITKSLEDFGICSANDEIGSKIMKIPAALFCYWMGLNELEDFKI